MNNHPSPINRDTLERAHQAGKKLKGRLEKQILGKQKAALACRCGEFHGEVVEAVGLNLVDIDGQYASQIGMWHLWSVQMRRLGSPHNQDFDYAVPLSEFISVKTLELAFREVFEPLGVPVNHAKVSFYTAPIAFDASGCTRILSVNEPLFVRPIANHILFHSAEVRLQNAVPRFDPKTTLLACGIDPFGCHFGGRSFDYYDPQPGYFAIRTGEGDKLLPLVRIVSVDQAAWTVDVETHAGMEFFDAWA